MFSPAKNFCDNYKLAFIGCIKLFFYRPRNVATTINLHSQVAINIFNQPRTVATTINLHPYGQSLQVSSLVISIQNNFIKKTDAACEPFASRKPVKNLAELTDGLITYMRWQGSGILFLSVPPISCRYGS